MNLLFAYDFVCPYAYLAFSQLERIEKRYDVTFAHIPVLLRGFYDKEKSAPIYRHPNKSKWSSFDLTLLANDIGVPIAHNDSFPFDSVHLMRGAIVAQKLGDYDRYVKEVFSAIWENNRDLSSLDNFFTWLERHGYAASVYAEQIQLSSVKQQLIQNLDQVYALGAFGTPSTFVDQQPYFGADRLRFVEKAIESKQQKI